MYCFHAAPNDYRKVFFVLRHNSPKHHETLAVYYIGTYEHLIPSDVEFSEYDPEKGTAQRLRWFLWVVFTQSYVSLSGRRRAEIGELLLRPFRQVPASRLGRVTREPTTAKNYIQD